LHEHANFGHVSVLDIGTGKTRLKEIPSERKILGQSLATKLVVVLGYNLT